jgi:hypothetical protein
MAIYACANGSNFSFALFEVIGATKHVLMHLPIQHLPSSNLHYALKDYLLDIL